MKVRIPKITITRATKKKIILSMVFVIGFLTMIAHLVVKVALWFDFNKVTFASPILVETQRVITVEQRVEKVVNSVVVIDYPEDIDTDIEKYICEKWGLVDCKMALAVAKAESGLNCDAVNINTNGTADLGPFQLNTVHLNKGGEWTLENMANCYKNIDLAHELWNEQGWNPWVAYLNGAFLAKY